MKLYNIIVTTTVIFSGIQYAFSQSPFNSDFEISRLSRIDSVIDNAIASHEIPGAVALVIHQGHEILHKSYGYSDIEREKPTRKDDIFRIASMTKAITTVGVMILYERGYFLLNDPISKYLPEFKNPQVIVKSDSLGNILETRPAKREISIMDLLTHRSGISYPFIPNMLQAVYKKNDIIDAISTDNVLLEEKMKKLAGLPLLFDPGSKYQYGLSADVLGYLIQVITKKSLKKFFHDEIFEPLGMMDTDFYFPESKSDRLVSLYSWIKDRGLVQFRNNFSPIEIDDPDFPIVGAKTYFSGGRGLSSTASDYGKFIQMLLNQGEFNGKRILSRKAVEFLITPRVDVNDDGSPEFGLGNIYIVNEAKKLNEIGSLGSYLGSGAFYGFFWIDPSEDLCMVFLSQVHPAQTNVAEKFRVAVYQALK